MRYLFFLLLCFPCVTLFSMNLCDALEDNGTDCDRPDGGSLTGFCESGAVVKSGDYVPLYQANNQHGLISPVDNSLYVRGGLEYSYKNKSFLFDAGADMVFDAIKYTPFFKNNVRLHQLYFGVALGKASLQLGMKEHSPDFVNPELSSGNMVWSENSRPVPMVRFETNDYVSVCKWLNFKLNVAYGKLLDGDYRQAEYDAFMSHYTESPYHFSPLAKDVYIHYKSFYIKTKADAPVVLTVGGEHAAMFGGSVNGVKYDVSFQNLINTTFFKNANGGEENTQLASFDIRIDANLKSNRIGVFGQLFMDAVSQNSSLKDNGFDGLWGIEYSTKKKSVISNVVFEYLQTSNQEGPVFNPEDYKYGNLKEYYNFNHYYNDQMWGPWSNYGMSNGSPMLMSTIYNKDNAPLFLSTLVRVFHLGVKGFMSNKCSYKLKSGIINSWGEPFALFSEKRNDFSLLGEFMYDNNSLHLKVSASFDTGKLYGNNMGLMISLRKSLNF